MTQKNIPDCCKADSTKKGIVSGIIYGLVPHAGCIAFMLAAVFGATAAMSIIKPLLLSSYFFYGLIALSLVFATISAVIYLYRHKSLSAAGIKHRWKYLSILYGTTIIVNLLFFMVIFPMVTAQVYSGEPANVPANGVGKLTINVDIPCPGHAPLISEELKKVEGVQAVKYNFPNEFVVAYDASKTSKDKILGILIFQTYPAKVK